MPISWFLALRFLREGRAQSALIVLGAAVGVAVMVFLSALIGGLQTSLVAQTLGTQAHIVVRPADELARPMLRATAATDVLARVERTAQRARSIDRWQHVLARLSHMPGVTAVSPVVAGPAIATRANATRAVLLIGAEAARFAAIYPIRRRMVSGGYDPSRTGCVIGRELAADLGVSVGDKLRLSTGGESSEMYTVEGVFDLGNREVNRRWLLVATRSAQSLLDLSGGVTSIELRVASVFEAESIAAAVRSSTGLVADSWMQSNAQLLVALRSQSSSSEVIQVFVILAVAMGIASVLVVSVAQKRREIGILRAMGTRRSTIVSVFLLQGAIVGVVGSLVGAGLGAGLGAVFAGVARNADGTPTFPFAISWALIGRSSLLALATGVLAAALPARSAARLDPAEAIRNG
ncbi:MAG: ABC transporter permease [Myxococcales bacterium]|nr:ABC transporter permease [Myxococcales bacterium]